MSTDVDEGTAALFILIEEHAPCRNSTSSYSTSSCEVNVAECAHLGFSLEVLSLSGLSCLITDCEELA